MPITTTPGQRKAKQQHDGATKALQTAERELNDKCTAVGRLKGKFRQDLQALVKTPAGSPQEKRTVDQLNKKIKDAEKLLKQTTEKLAALHTAVQNTITAKANVANSTPPKS